VQEALAELGLDVGQVDGMYGPTTASAIEELYQRTGFAMPSPPMTPADLAQAEQTVRAAELATRAASTAVDNARAAVSSADASGRADAELALAEAEVALAGARLARDAAVAARNSAAEGALTPLPQREILFVPETGMKVVQPQASRGVVLESGLATLEGEGQRIVALVPRSQAQVLELGDDATVVLPDTDVSGEIVWVAPVVGPAGASGRFDDTLDLSIGEGQVVVELRAAGRIDFSGTFRVLMTDSSQPRMGLVVPLSAVRVDAGGIEHVSAASSQEGPFRRVDVVVRASRGGRALVDADGDLQPDSYVAIGDR
jgi:hypothetical protein